MRTARSSRSSSARAVGHALVGLAVLSLTTGAVAAPKKKPVAVVAPPEPVLPPAPPTLSQTLTGDAKADYDAGKLLFVDRDFQGAALKFRGAYTKSNDVRLLWNIAACEKNLRHYANVLQLVRQYQKDGAATLTQSDQTEASDLIRTIEPFTATLALTASEPDADVFLDEEKIGTTPLASPVVVDLGVRKLRVSKAGYRDVLQDVSVGGSPTISVSVKLEKIVHQGYLVVTAGPKDAITIDGTQLANGTWAGTLPSGGHLLRVSAPDMRPYQSDVIVVDNETRSLNITLDKEKSGIPAWVWIGGGVIVASGIALGAYALFKPGDHSPDLPVGTLDPGNVQAARPVVRFR